MVNVDTFWDKKAFNLQKKLLNHLFCLTEASKGRKWQPYILAAIDDKIW